MRPPTAACVCLSVCCPHFEDKRDLLLGLAEELAARGVRTTLALAGRIPCSHIIRLGGDLSKCAFWFDRLRDRATASLETEVVGARPDLEAQVDEVWVGIVDDEPRVWQGQRLDRIARASIVRRLSGASIEGADLALVNAYEKDTLRHLIYYRELLLRRQPEVVVYFGGQFHQDRTAFLASREARVSAFAIESSFVPDCVYCDEAGVTSGRGEIGAPSLLHEMESAVLSAEQRTTVDQLMARSFQSLGLPPAEAERKRVRLEMDVRADERVVLFLGQVGYDASLTIDGGAFSDQGLAVAATHSAVSSLPGTTLVVRPHPKSQGTSDSASETAAGLGVRMFREGVPPLPTLLELLHAADVVVTVNSQAGLQAAWLGIPVVTLGHASYSSKGFTVEAGGHLELLRACLVAALATPYGKWRHSAVSYISALGRHMVDRPTPARLASRILETR